MTSFIDMIRQEGREEGIHEGIEKGRIEGRDLGMKELLVISLAKKFGPVSDEVSEEIHALQSPDVLADLNIKLGEARSLEDFLVALRSHRQ